MGGVRWWNVKHPRAYADRLDRGLSPAAGRETVTGEGAVLERLMLGVRLAVGTAARRRCPTEARPSVAGLVADGLVDGRAATGGRRIVLTRRGRLLATPSSDARRLERSADQLEAERVPVGAAALHGERREDAQRRG